MEYIRHEGGWIEVICGSMFSGKSEELIRRLRRAQIARQSVQIFKPEVDSRYSLNHITSHSEMSLEAEPASCASDILNRVRNSTTVLGIDEAQFFDLGLVDVCNRLANEGKRVIVAGLDQDYLGKPFDPMPQLLAIAEYISKTHAICMKCGGLANYSQRLSRDTARVVLGTTDSYEARCRRCYNPNEAQEGQK
jgi:thymidine kinase